MQELSRNSSCGPVCSVEEREGKKEKRRRKQVNSVLCWGVLCCVPPRQAASVCPACVAVPGWTS